MDQPIRVLVVDDDEAHAEAVAETLERVGYECVVASSGAEGLRLIEEQTFDIIITDLMMEGINGLDILRKAKQELPDAEVVILTGHGTIKTAVTAMQAGATTYLTKPLDINELRMVVDKASQSQRLARSNIELKKQLNERFGFEGVVGNSPLMHALVERLRHIAPTTATVLISGENGTGKELVARALHVNSPRAHKPFVAINCAALNENIIDSELFGHVKGSYTGADRDRKGLFEHANGGTLFLDEVGDLPMSTQVRLLRVLENREILRVGTNDPLKVDVRVISASNREMNELIQEGKFRQDLYHRLKVVTIKLPPLRARREDIPLLIDYFLKQFTKVHGKPIRGVSVAARKAITSYPWPGNVRELKNAIESMVVIDTDGLLDIDDLTEELFAQSQLPSPPAARDHNAVSEATSATTSTADVATSARAPGPGPGPAPSASAPSIGGGNIPIARHHAEGNTSVNVNTFASPGATAMTGQTMEDIEKHYIIETLKLTQGNREEASRILGIGERTLYRKIKLYNIEI